MKKNIVLATILAVLLAWMVMPVFASESKPDEPEQVYTWIQEGDSVFCYINNGGWSEAEMLVGWHTIDGETYYFYPQEMVDARYGEMAKGEVWIGAWVCYFDNEGHLTDCQRGVW